MKVEVFIRSKNIDARGVYDTINGNMLVLKNSQIIEEVSDHFKDTGYDLLRAQLIKKGIIKGFVHTVDHLYNSPSQAASIIQGRSANGRIEWITKDGVAIKSLNSKEQSSGRDVKENERFINILEELFALCDERANKEIEKLNKEIIKRLDGISENMLDDVIKLKDKIKDIKLNAHSLENVKKIFSELWNDEKVEEMKDFHFNNLYLDN